MTIELRGGSVLSEEGEWIPQNLRLDGDTIVDVGTDDLTPADGDIVDVQGSYLLPGLIDAHCHLAHYEGIDVDEAVDVWAAIRARAESLVAAGITTIRDMGSVRRLGSHARDAFDAGEGVGPRIVSAGQYIAQRNGHKASRARVADTVDEVREAVQAEVAGGADFVKLMCSGGVFGGEDPYAVEYSSAHVTAAVEEAARHGRYVSVHAHPAGAIEMAALSGVRSIEHASGITADLAEMLSKTEIFVTPTFATYALGAERVPTDRERQAARAMLAEKLESFQEVLNKDVKWAVGSDAAGPTPITALHDELVILHRHFGFPWPELIRKASEGNAKLIDRPTLGALKAGYEADVLVYREDPVSEPMRLRHPTKVISRGRQVLDQ